MDLPYCAVITQSHGHLVVPVSWLENKENKLTKVFYSPNQNEKADFNLPVKYFSDTSKRAVYNAFIVQFMRKYDQMHLWKIPLYTYIWTWNGFSNRSGKPYNFQTIKFSLWAIEYRLFIWDIDVWGGMSGEFRLWNIPNEFLFLLAAAPSKTLLTDI